MTFLIILSNIMIIVMMMMMRKIFTSVCPTCSVMCNDAMVVRSAICDSSSNYSDCYSLDCGFIQLLEPFSRYLPFSPPLHPIIHFSPFPLSNAFNISSHLDALHFPFPFEASPLRSNEVIWRMWNFNRKRKEKDAENENGINL